MKERAAHRFNGRRGGGFVPDDAPVLDKLPGAVRCVCLCAEVRCWWIAVVDVGSPCWACGSPLRVSLPL